MANVVLADVTRILPSVLKRVPWWTRAFLLALLVVAGGYIILASIFGWPLSEETLTVFGIFAPVAGLPALSNVTVGQTEDTPLADRIEAVAPDAEALARAVAEQLHALGIEPPSPAE